MTAKVAFEILYRDYYVRVFGLCRRLLNSESLAEDAAQDTFMRAYRSFAKYDSNQPFWHWIASIASNRCIDLLRKRQRIGKVFSAEELNVEEVASGEAEVTDVIDSEADAEVLRAAVADLPEKYRLPLVLAYYGDMTYEQVAQNLEISSNHVGVLLLRARQRLRSRLAEAGMTEPSS